MAQTAKPSTSTLRQRIQPSVDRLPLPCDRLIETRQTLIGSPLRFDPDNWLIEATRHVRLNCRSIPRFIPYRPEPSPTYPKAARTKNPDRVSPSRFAASSTIANTRLGNVIFTRTRSPDNFELMDDG